MNRREFSKRAMLTALSVPLLSNNELFSAPKKEKLVSSYYLRAHTYTLVPHQVREDMKWMADIGTQAVDVGVLEQDLYAAVENIEYIVEAAHKEGMKVFAVPSRWGGMIAGAPKVPSVFSTLNPQTWILNDKGKPLTSGVSGVLSSVHYPEVLDFFCNSLTQIFKNWDISGIIWDEIKILLKDYSEMAIKNLGVNAKFEQHVDAVCDFFSKVNTHIKSIGQDKSVHAFLFANKTQIEIDRVAQIKNMDYYGSDGRPWRMEDGGALQDKNKVLLGKNCGERFIEVAKNNNVKSLMLIENHEMNEADNLLMDKRLPEVFALDVDHYIYYYYPRSLKDPEGNMKIIKKHVKKFLG